MRITELKAPVILIREAQSADQDSLLQFHADQYLLIML
jgi:hypothetical protein